MGYYACSAFIACYFFYFLAEARSLQLVGSVPATVFAGTSFSLTFNILDKDGVKLTDGTDSVLFGEMQVAWENDTVLMYEKIEEEEMILFQEMVNTIIIPDI